MESWREELYHSGVGVCFVDEWTDELKHFGVKGMKWGFRKKKEEKSKYNKNTKYNLLSQLNEELARIREKSMEINRLASYENRMEEAKKKAVELLKELDPNFVNTDKYIWETYKRTSIIQAAFSAANKRSDEIYDRKKRMGYR